MCCQLAENSRYSCVSCWYHSNGMDMLSHQKKWICGKTVQTIFIWCCPVRRLSRLNLLHVYGTVGQINRYRISLNNYIQDRGQKEYYIRGQTNWIVSRDRSKGQQRDSRQRKVLSVSMNYFGSNKSKLKLSRPKLTDLRCLPADLWPRNHSFSLNEMGEGLP